MITSINSYQSNQSFNASLKAPKINGKFKNIAPKIAEEQIKLKNLGMKVKDELKNMDNETKNLLYKTALLYSILVAFFVYVALVVKNIADKLYFLFE